MNTNQFRKVFSCFAVFVGLISISTSSFADPYFITYSGIIEDSSFPEVNNQEQYSATLVFDNGASSTLSQTWDEADLTCAIWIMNDVHDVLFTHDLTSQGSLVVSGSATTDGGGVLSANFEEVTASPVDSGTYTSVGIALVDPLNWFMNDANNVFYSDSQAISFGDPANGVLMAPSNWTNPAPYLSGDCSAAAAANISTSAVPFAPLWVLALLTGLLMLVGGRRLVRTH